MTKYNRLSGTLYEVLEVKGFAKIKSYVNMPSRLHILSDVKKMHKKQNKLRGLK